MATMKIKKMILGAVQTNCYLVFNDDTKEGIIIDPADSAERIIATIGNLQVKPVGILLTHGHFDHILAADFLKEHYGISVYLHKEEADLAANTGLNASKSFGMYGTAQADVLAEDGEVLDLSGFSIKVLHTPGHTKGGACYYFENDQVLFSGDTLFAQSIGRTDLPTGSYSTLIRSVKEKLFTLPGKVLVFPGHGEETTIEYEMKYNPYVNI